jgi:hypothetical protein
MVEYTEARYPPQRLMASNPWFDLIEEAMYPTTVSQKKETTRP